MKVMIQTGIGWKGGKSSNPVNSLLSYSPVRLSHTSGSDPCASQAQPGRKGLFSDDELIFIIFRIGLKNLNKLGQILRINTVNVQCSLQYCSYVM